MVMMNLTLRRPHQQRACAVRRRLPVTPWAMIRVRNEHSHAFRGRYSPETSPWGVEIIEAQYWPHVRNVDVVAPPQVGKTFHVCEVPTLYDLCEGRETVFYMNGSADNALNIWTARWIKTLRADPVLSQQVLDRMDAGRWDERHFADGGLLYSAGPESATALSQRESRIVRCSELEKTRSSLGNEASSYALARDRAAAYPGNCMITSDCTVTIREGLSWIRFREGDRSRPFIPCPACGHYACPAHERHLGEADLALAPETVHMLEIPALSLSTPSAAEETTRLVCRKCGYLWSVRELRESIRATVWVPVGCHVVRHDDTAKTPIPRVRWLDELRAWAGDQLANADVVEGKQSPGTPPAWSGPRLPEGVELAWTPASAESDLFPQDPRKASSRSFWLWRIFAPKYTIGQIGKEIVQGENGSLTGDKTDDYKSVTQKCLVLPYVELVIGDSNDLNEDAVMLTVGELPRGAIPDGAVVSAGVDINEDAVRAVKRAWSDEGNTYLVDHRTEWTGLVEYKRGQGRKVDRASAIFKATRRQAIQSALDRVWAWIGEAAMTYIDAGSEWADEIYEWCATKTHRRLRPIKGLGLGSPKLRRGGLMGAWTDSCEKQAAQCQDAKKRPLKHQFYDPKDVRMMMRLHVDHWRKEVHNAIKISVLAARGQKMNLDDAVAKPFFFLHADVKRNDDYVSQVVAERWEQWINPRTQKQESGWKEYHADNHFLDCEGYAFAAAAAMGVDVGSSVAVHVGRKVKYGVVGKSW